MGYQHFGNKTKISYDPVFKEFMDSDRYETTSKTNPQFLVFKIIFDEPWKVSVN